MGVGGSVPDLFYLGCRFEVQVRGCLESLGFRAQSVVVGKGIAHDGTSTDDNAVHPEHETGGRTACPA